MKTNRLLITLGDACGVGPEIIAQAFAQGQANDCCVVGDVAVLRRALRQLGLSLPVVQLDSVAEPTPPGCLPIWQVPGLPRDLAELAMGQINAASGAAAAACICAAVAAIQSGQAQGLVTAPIHKEAWAKAGVEFPGHTEMLQALAAGVDGNAPLVGTALPPVRMMLANEELRTVLVTIHCSLRQAIEQISQDSVFQTIVIAHRALQSFGIAAPRIAVAGLNPHAGEGGLFGDEEVLHIAPAIAQAQAQGISAQGPFAPDTVFMRARHTATHAGEFDLVIAMTHDHGLIPVKYLGVEQGVNVTLGLPFVRTSPDHGTAFDIAGNGQADASSLLAAIRMARRLLHN